MLPRLNPGDSIADEYLAFLDALPEAGYGGEIRHDYAARLLTATDNSVYQVLPEAVLFPRATGDVSIVLKLLTEERFRSVTLTARGGGTGTNGQSLTDGLVLDVSRHMDNILEVNLEDGWVRVQPGVVLDQLNDHLAPHGVFFAPNLSPSSRATLGGMISTDAAGKGSGVYGKTSEHVLGLRTVLLDGTVLDSAPEDEVGLKLRMDEPGRSGELHRILYRVVSENTAAIERVFPNLRRFMTGYNLARLWNPHTGAFDLNALLSGSEGTLGVVVEAKLKLTPIPKERRLVLLKYAAFQDALGNAEDLVEHRPSAIETIDETILTLARDDALYPRIREAVESGVDGPVAAINLVEFEGGDAASVEASVRGLIDSVNDSKRPFTPIGYYLAKDSQEADALWALRKKGVGLLGKLPGRKKPAAFVEDTVVHPSRLREYIAAFRKILDEEGVRYGMFGHIDVGCLHVRPALDMRDPEDEARLRRISDKVCDLVHGYGGLIWGEHGKGFRSEYSPRFFGEVYPLLQEVKAAFDPHNQLNPGKLATPAGRNDELVSIDAPTRGQRDREIFPEAQVSFSMAIDCNGNGACFDYQPDHVMCPSAKVTRDRVHSPKGRASVMREWLRQLARHDHHLAQPSGWFVRGLQWPIRAWNLLAKRPDYSQDVYDAMAGCLSCKACATQCPIKVDVPAMKSSFLEAYHSRYPRPLRDYLIAGLEGGVAFAVRLPKFIVGLGGSGIARGILKRIGLVDTPLPKAGVLRDGLESRGLRECRDTDLRDLAPEIRERAVIIIQDAFTSHLEPEVLLATIDVLRTLGFRPFLAPFFENGKGLHVKGFLSRFRKLAQRNHERLAGLASHGIPLVGIEPAVTLTYDDEYREALTDSVEPVRVQLLQEWLANALSQRDLPKPAAGFPLAYRLFAHCTERTAAPNSEAAWVQVYRQLGLALEPAVLGCCGMCGVFGHEREHLDESLGIFDMSWRPALADDSRPVVVSGYSCRSQVTRATEERAPHPMEVLKSSLIPTTTS